MQIHNKCYDCIWGYNEVYIFGPDYARITDNTDYSAHKLAASPKLLEQQTCTYLSQVNLPSHQQWWGTES